MKNIKDKLDSIDLIVENDILFNQLVLECESTTNECNVNIKEIRKKAKITKLDFTGALKVACFSIVCIFLWEIGFSNINLTYAKNSKIVKNENITTFSSKFEKFTENFKIFERR